MSMKDSMDIDQTEQRTSEQILSVQKLVYEAISKCDPDLRVNLFQNIVLTGGTSMFNGFPERLFSELHQLAPSVSFFFISQQQTRAHQPLSLQYKTKIIAPQNSIERKFSSWIGGSILTSLGSFHQMWISKAEYDERGSSVVEKKCP